MFFKDPLIPGGLRQMSFLVRYKSPKARAGARSSTSCEPNQVSQWDSTPTQHLGQTMFFLHPDKDKDSSLEFRDSNKQSSVI